MSTENPTPVVEVVRSGAPQSSGKQFENPFEKYLNYVALSEISKLDGEGIHAAIWAVKVSTPAVEKLGDLVLGQNKVAFTKVEDIRKALYPLFAEFGIMAYIELVDSDETLQVAEEPWTMAQAVDPETGKVDRNGVIGDTGRPVRDGKIPTTRMWAWVEYRIRFVFIGDGSEVVVGPVKGSAYDTNSDKATGKATTAAIKRILSETFDIVDEKEDDNDSENHENDNRPATTDRRTAQEGTNRGGQARNAAAPGATSRPGRPGRPKPEANTAAEAQANAQKAADVAAAAETAEQAVEAEKPTPTEPPAKAEEHPTTDLQQPAEKDLAAADQATGEVNEESPAEPTVKPETPPAAPTAPMPDKLAAAKLRVKNANAKLNLGRAEVDALATEVTGIATREEWIVNSVALAKLADALEARI